MKNVETTRRTPTQQAFLPLHDGVLAQHQPTLIARHLGAETSGAQIFLDGGNDGGLYGYGRNVPVRALLINGGLFFLSSATEHFGLLHHLSPKEGTGRFGDNSY